MRQKSGEHLGLPRIETLLVRRERFPGGECFRTGGEPGVLWDHAEFLLSVEDFLAHPVPSLIELAAILRDPFSGRVQRRMRCTRREIEKKWLLGRGGALRVQPANGVVDHVGGEMVALLRRMRWL